jgi:hypothetical protein
VNTPKYPQNSSDVSWFHPNMGVWQKAMLIIHVLIIKALTLLGVSILPYLYGNIIFVYRSVVSASMIMDVFINTPLTMPNRKAHSSTETLYYRNMATNSTITYILYYGLNGYGITLFFLGINILIFFISIATVILNGIIIYILFGRSASMIMDVFINTPLTMPNRKAHS